MKFRTHLVFAFFLALLLDVRSFFLMFLFLLFSLLPDIDVHTSVLGRKIKPLSWFFEIVLGHRGILHSLWPVIFLYLWNPWLIWPLLAYISHLFLDSLTKKGVAWFWPFLRIKGPFVSGKFVDSLLFYFFLGASLFLFLL